MNSLRGYLYILCALIIAPFATSAQRSPNPYWIRALEWSPTGDYIAIATQNGNIEILDGQNQSLYLTLQEADAPAVYTLQWSPDGKQLASAGKDTRIKIWDAETGKVVQILQATTDAIRSLSWSPDGQLLASASQEGYPQNANIWNATTGEIVFSPTVGEVLSVAWSPDGDILAITKIGEIQLWNIAEQRHIKTIETPEYVLSLMWHPDGSQIVSADTLVAENSAIRIWDVSTTQLLYEVKGHTDTIISVRWDATGDLLATASHDQTVRVWDTRNWEEIAQYQANDSVFAAAFSPYGGRLAFSNTPNLATPDTTQNIQIVVPAPSLERLRAIAEGCGVPSTITLTNQLDTFIAEIDTMPDGAIPRACVADLIAMANALQEVRGVK